MGFVRVGWSKLSGVATIASVSTGAYDTANEGTDKSRWMQPKTP
jgi:hypothetical protein